MLNKKAQLPVKQVFEIVAAIAIFFLFVQVAGEFGTGEIFQKIILTENLAFATNTLHITPDNSFIIFQKDISRYQYNFDQGKIEVSIDPNDPELVTRTFIENLKMPISTKLNNPENLIIGKNGGSLEISDQFISNDQQRCPSIPVQNLNQITLIPQTKNNLIYPFTESLSAFLANSEVVDLPITDQKELILEIEVTNEQKTAKAFINPNLKSKKLACLIINNLINNYEDITTLIIPTDRYSLKNAEIGIYLELSQDLETPQTLALIKKSFEDFQK